MDIHNLSCLFSIFFVATQCKTCSVISSSSKSASSSPGQGVRLEIGIGGISSEARCGIKQRIIIEGLLAELGIRSCVVGTESVASWLSREGQGDPKRSDLEVGLGYRWHLRGLVA